MSGTFTTSLSSDEFISAYWFYARWLWLWKRMAIALVIVTVVYALLMMAIDGFSYGFTPEVLGQYLVHGAVYALILAVVLITTTLYTLPRRLRQLYDDLRAADRETRYEFDSSGLRSANRDGTTNLEWDRFKFWIENDRFLVFVLSRWSFVIVPKSQVAATVLADLCDAATTGGITRR